MQPNNQQINESDDFESFNIKRKQSFIADIKESLAGLVIEDCDSNMQSFARWLAYDITDAEFEDLFEYQGNRLQKSPSVYHTLPGTPERSGCNIYGYYQSSPYTYYRQFIINKEK